MSRSSRNRTGRALGVALTFGCILAGCSDLYYDRRETIAFGGTDAVATNNAVQMADPWPAGSRTRVVEGNGVVVEGAIERYRTGQVIPPRGNSTSNSAAAPPPAAAPPAATPVASKSP